MNKVNTIDYYNREVIHKCLATDNMYIPVSVLDNCEVSTKVDEENRLLLNLSYDYSKPTILARNNGKYKDAIGHYFQIYEKVVFNNDKVLRPYAISNNRISNPDNTEEIYMINVIPTYYIFKHGIVNRRDELYNKQIILISRKLVEDKIFYRNLNNIYLEEASKIYDVLITDDIYEKVFNPIKLTFPTFDTIDQAMNNREFNRMIMERFNIQPINEQRQSEEFLMGTATVVVDELSSDNPDLPF